MKLFSWPRSQLLEIGDQSWCPSWLHRHEQLVLTQLWNLRVPGWSRGSLATQACAVFKEQLKDLSSYTVLDICAGAGGPTPVLELELNKQLESEGKGPVQFVLTDLYPHISEWERISKKQQNVTYIESPVDARTVPRFAASSKKECRIFNICFHHFGDEDAAGILKNAIESADSFMQVMILFISYISSANSILSSIFEITARDLWTCLCSPLVFFFTFFVTLVWYLDSPVHLLFTFILPVAPLTIFVDGLISCLRTRTAKETWQLLDQPDLDLTNWTFHSGQKVVQFPFITLYYHVGIKS
ncbi:uncharacterized protein N7500_000278 [Penicillium coprophilum]|uniref:uncharacterized protein n=1 Tax=Penicillium coprophilum TaxID=36646 RepID=UPI0023A02DB5|nr:uncharacterized protein N7500_000278 [Penicillium coprophilum]KAJ5177579.1 hypothetical protein N7500_000278 [Penicillium coprophilum]